MATLNISPKTRIQLNQVLFITVFWTITGLLLALYKSVVYDDANDNFIIQAPKNLPLITFLLINMIGPMIGGIFGGSLIVFFSKNKLRDRSYLQFIVITCIMFLFIIFVINTVVSFIFYYSHDLSMSGGAFFLESVRLFVTDPYALRNLFTWLIITVMTLFVLQVSDKYGPRNLSRFILGKYFRPREENRIFMMLDINASTTLAEKLGHIKFFSLVNQFFADITDSITNSKGEIYQYVGDEVIVSWTIKKGVQNVNCLQCFFDMEEAIKKRSAIYIQQYNCIPEFKAGVHVGSVTVGEIGVIKKDIAYLGDALNATARILSLCHTYHEKLIISQQLFERLDSFSATLNFRALGNVQLKGKEQPVVLMGVRKELPEKEPGNSSIGN